MGGERENRRERVMLLVLVEYHSSYQVHSTKPEDS
jgi:hypothetical protein